MVVSRGTARLAHLINVIPDAELDAPSLLPGWRRREVIAHVACHGAALSRLADAVATGNESSSHEIAEPQAAEVSRACTLRDDALRNLFTHTVARLNRAWAGVRDPVWDVPVVTAQGSEVPFSETLRIRAREVWVHAVDLATGAGFSQIPQELLLELLGDAERGWREQDLDLGLDVDPGSELHAVRVGDRIVVRAPLPVLAWWATGRLVDQPLVLDDGHTIAPPRWR